MKVITTLILFVFSITQIFSLGFDWSVDRNSIKIGEEILLDIRITGDESVDNPSIIQIETVEANNSLIQKKSEEYRDGNSTGVRIIFTFIEPGDYKGIVFRTSIDTGKGSVIARDTPAFDITVLPVLTEEQIESVQNAEDPQNISILHEHMGIEPFKFRIAGILIIVGIIIVILAALFIGYYFIYQLLFKKKNNEIDLYSGLSPFERFLVDFQGIVFEPSDTYQMTLVKISRLTAVFKELIHAEYKVNAPSSTTREFVALLRTLKFDITIINNINLLLNRLDMVKFAKGAITYDELAGAREKIKVFAAEINHNYIRINQQQINSGKSAEE